MIRSIEVKIYPNAAQRQVLGDWLRDACWIYNRALEQRIKAYERRGKCTNLYQQAALLTEWRLKISRIKNVPVDFARDSLRRVDRGMQAFFRRVKAGEKPGFPRFRSHLRFNSIEALRASKYLLGRGMIRIPKIGLVKFRAGDQVIPPTQKLLRIIRRPKGWFAQVLVEDGKPVPDPRPVLGSVGIDVGLTTFAAMSNGEKIPNPRFLQSSARRMKHAQRVVSRRVKGSRRRRKAIHRLRVIHERIRLQRRNFAHKLSTDLVRRFDLIAIEDLNVRGLARSRLAKSVNDAAWSIFTAQLERKAECAGVRLVKVDPRGTSQTCPKCGNIAAKSLSERVHRCECGAEMCRDIAAAQVILARALGVSPAVVPVEGSASGQDAGGPGQVAPVKREVCTT